MIPVTVGNTNIAKVGLFSNFNLFKDEKVCKKKAKKKKKESRSW